VQDFWAVVFNPSFPYRLAHMVVAAFLATSLAIAAVCAWQVLNRVGLDTARRGLTHALGLAAVLAPLQVFLGDQHGLEVLEHQPLKVGAMEGLWPTPAGAPLLLFALPDPSAEANRYELAVPNASSLVLTHSLDGEVKGLKEVAPGDRPYVPLVFFAFRV